MVVVADSNIAYAKSRCAYQSSKQTRCLFWFLSNFGNYDPISNFCKIV